MQKDLSYVLQLADDLGTELPAASLAHELLGRVVDAGLANKYHTAVVRVIEGQLP
jgi:3-hydroxyisobutyrate dehydrogenase-like beta-hydroxyacid dehydrogenase